MGKKPSPNNFFETYFFRNRVKQVKVDRTSANTYIVGEAVPRAREDEPLWAITKFEVVGDSFSEITPAQDGSVSLRWVDRDFVFDPSFPPDGSPADIVLDNFEILDGLTAGAVVANITTLTSDPVRTHTYTITNDPDAKFDISGEQLVMESTADIADGSYQVTIETEDDLGRTLARTFTLSVVPVPQFTDFTRWIGNGGNAYGRSDTLATWLQQSQQHIYSFWVEQDFPNTSSRATFGLRFDANTYFSIVITNTVVQLRYKNGASHNQCVMDWAINTISQRHFRLDCNFTVTSRSSAFRLYLDGIEQSPSVNSGGQVQQLRIDFSVGQFWLGRNPASSNQYQRKALNDFSIWTNNINGGTRNYLTQDGVPNDLFQAPQSSRLQAWYSFENRFTDELGVYDLEEVNIDVTQFEDAP